MRALALSGGSAKGAFQVGVLKRWMGDEGIDYDIMCGVSVGALNIAGLAMSPLGQPRDAIARVEELWRTKINPRAVFDRWRPFGRLHALKRSSVYDSSPLRRLVRDSFDSNLIRQSGRQLAVGATCIETGEFRYGRQDDPLFNDWVLASSSCPVLMEPVEIDGMLWCDGGIRHMTPLRQAIRMGADEVDVIMCNNPQLTSPWNSTGRAAIPDYLLRTIDLLSDQILRADLQLVGLMNDVVVRSDKHRHVKVRVVCPRERLITDTLDFDPKEIARLIEMGYHGSLESVIYG